MAGTTDSVVLPETRSDRGEFGFEDRCYHYYLLAYLVLKPLHNSIQSPSHLELFREERHPAASRWVLSRACFSNCEQREIGGEQVIAFPTVSNSFILISLRVAHGVKPPRPKMLG